MEEVPGGAETGGVLRFFGMETKQKAVEVTLWVLPYVLLLAAGLAILSYTVQWFFPLPLWIHFIAIALALLYFFFFLARVRQMGAEARNDPEN